MHGLDPRIHDEAPHVQSGIFGGEIHQGLPGQARQ
jgi:hypothetical protein